MTAKELYSGQDVDTGKLALRLKHLASDIANGRGLVTSVSSEHNVDGDDTESVRLTIELTPTKDSIACNGFNIPFEDGQ